MIKLTATGAALIAVTYGLARFALGLFVPELREEFGLSGTATGWIMAASYGGYLAALALAGAAIERAGARTVAIAGGLLAALGTAGIAVAPTAPFLAAAAGLGGMSTGWASTALAAAVQSQVTRMRRAAAQTIVNAGTSLGLIVAAPAAVLAGTMWRAPWLLFSAAAGAVTIVTATAINRTEAVAGARRRAVDQRASRPANRDAGRRVSPRLACTALLLGVSSAAFWTFGRELVEATAGLQPAASRMIWLVVGAGGLIGAGYMALTGLLIVWAVRERPHQPGAAVAVAFLVLAAGQIAGSPLAGVVVDAVGPASAFVAAAGTAAFALVVLPPYGRRRWRASEHTLNPDPGLAWAGRDAPPQPGHGRVVTSSSRSTLTTPTQRGPGRTSSRTTRFVQATPPIILGVRRLISGGWPRRTRTLLAGGVAAVVAGTVGLVPGPADAATPCVRTVAIDAQQSAGEGAGEVVFTVRSGGCAAAGSVDYTVRSGTAEAGTDFLATSGTLRWTAGDLRPRPVSVMVVPDLLVEAALEDFRMWLKRPSAGVSVTADVGLGRILDDDAPRPLWAVDDLPCGDLQPNQVCRCLPQLAEEPISIRDSVVERWVRILPTATPDRCAGELWLSTPLPEPASVQWSTRDGTAVAGVDYVAVTDQLLKVPAGTPTVNLPVEILPPRPGMPARWFTIQVNAVSPGVLADPVAVVALPPS